MSVQRECMYIETSPGKWYIVVEDCDAPRNAFDWLDNAQAYGPYETFDKAHDGFDMLGEPNPGGFHECPYEEGQELSENLQALIDKAKRPSRNRFGW